MTRSNFVSRYKSWLKNKKQVNETMLDDLKKKKTDTTRTDGDFQKY